MFSWYVNTKNSIVGICLDENEEVLLLQKRRTIAFKACCKENILVILEFVFKTFIINVRGSVVMFK